MRVFKEFEKMCDKYIAMFELYCERNVLVPRFKDSKVYVLYSFVIGYLIRRYV